MSLNVLYTDNGFQSIEIERDIIGAAGAELVVAQCKTPEEVMAFAAGADGLLVQWAPITQGVIAKLGRCKVIVRLGIGVDNVDVRAATAKGIPVCNVPDYCLDEVTDHTISLALTLARQIPFVDRRVRARKWQITPDAPMPAFRDMTYSTVGFGRIAQVVHERVCAFGFRRIAYDPYVSEDAFERLGVQRVSLHEAFSLADIVSLHCPLTDDTRHMVDAARLRQMKPSAILVNTARGGLVDTVALAEGLDAAEIASAGLDVFEEEPLPQEHPIRSCAHAVLTSHVAWYSERSVPELQKRAAEEIVRGLLGDRLRNCINPEVMDYEK